VSITIRTAVLKDRRAWFHVGAGIVADSIPEAEYDETLAKGRGLMEVLTRGTGGSLVPELERHLGPSDPPVTRGVE
jgi:anthranilate/para-aminobenzoate synthase component I